MSGTWTVRNAIAGAQLPHLAMPDLNDESLPVLLNSIQSRLVSSQRQLGIVNAQMKGRAREAKVQELTMGQLQNLGSETRVYKAVGKMYVLHTY